MLGKDVRAVEQFAGVLCWVGCASSSLLKCCAVLGVQAGHFFLLGSNPCVCSCEQEREREMCSLIKPVDPNFQEGEQERERERER